MFFHKVQLYDHLLGINQAAGAVKQGNDIACRLNIITSRCSSTARSSVETVFNVPGIGRLARDSLLRNDLPVLEGTVLFGAALVCLAGLLADAAQAWLDPQVRFGGARER